ncbi:MAG: hypothetical protein AB1644_06435 [Candidatus Zixiibacteriota bacterium]
MNVFVKLDPNNLLPKDLLAWTCNSTTPLLLRWTVDLTGSIEIREYTAEPDYDQVMPFYRFDVAKVSGNDTTNLATDVTTDASGHYSVRIPSTTNMLIYRFTTAQTGSLFPIYRRGSTLPIKGNHGTGVAGTASRTINVTMVDSLLPVPFARNTAFYAASRLSRDLYTTDSLFRIYGVTLAKIYIGFDSTNTVSQAVWRLNTAANPDTSWIEFRQNNYPVQTICHEIGHQLNYQLQGSVVRPASPFDTLPHYTYSVTDELFAFDEGFACFIQAVSTIPELVGDRVCGVRTWETNDWWKGPSCYPQYNTAGEIVEGAVGSILLDLYDDNSHPERRVNPDDDSVRAPSLMMPIILGCIQNYSDTAKTWTLRDFAERLVRVQSPRSSWYNNTAFGTLRTGICAIFQSYSLIVPPDYCKRTTAQHGCTKSSTSSARSCVREPGKSRK